MAHPTSYAIPYVVLVLVLVSVYFKIDLSQYVQLLTAMGIGGIPLSIINNAVNARKQFPITKDQIDQLLALVKK